MAARRCGLSVVLPTLLSNPTTRLVLVAVGVFLLVAAGIAQAPPQATTMPKASGQSEATIVVPAGTRFPLVLTHPVDSKTMHRGDEIYAQTTAPIPVGDQVAVPAGTFVQGKVEKLTRNGNRGDFLMQSLSLLFPNGYVARVVAATNIQSDEGTAWRNPSSGAKAGAIVAPMAGLGMGAAIGSAAHTTNSSTLGGTTITSSSPKGLAIGSTVGLAAGGVVSLVLLARGRQFFVDVSSPMEMTLPQPLTLDADKVADAVQQARAHPVPLPMPRPQPDLTPVANTPRPTPSSTNSGTCYTPGTPPTYIPGTPGEGGTPDIYIPGTPAVDGSPGTPPTYVPGTPGKSGTAGTYIPGTPPTPHPCP